MFERCLRNGVGSIRKYLCVRSFRYGPVSFRQGIAVAETAPEPEEDREGEMKFKDSRRGHEACWGIAKDAGR